MFSSLMLIWFACSCSRGIYICIYTIRLKFSNFYLISKLQIGIKMN